MDSHAAFVCTLQEDSGIQAAAWKQDLSIASYLAGLSPMPQTGQNTTFTPSFCSMILRDKTYKAV